MLLKGSRALKCRTAKGLKRVLNKILKAVITGLNFKSGFKMVERNWFTKRRTKKKRTLQKSETPFYLLFSVLLLAKK